MTKINIKNAPQIEKRLNNIHLINKIVFYSPSGRTVGIFIIFFYIFYIIINKIYNSFNIFQHNQLLNKIMSYTEYLEIMVAL